MKQEDGSASAALFNTAAAAVEADTADVVLNSTIKSDVDEVVEDEEGGEEEDKPDGTITAQNNAKDDHDFLLVPARFRIMVGRADFDFNLARVTHHCRVAHLLLIEFFVLLFCALFLCGGGMGWT